MFDAAVLDLVIDGKTIYPVVEALAARGVPFGFVSGMPRAGIDRKWQDRPFLDKPFEIDGVRAFLLNLLKGMDLPVALDQTSTVVSSRESDSGTALSERCANRRARPD